MRLSEAIFLACWSAAFVALHGCTAAEIQNVDPVVYVPGEYCLDAHGVYQPVIAGYFCCSDAPENLGPGECPEGTSCMLPDSCTTQPLPPNDEGAALKPMVTKRAGL